MFSHDLILLDPTLPFPKYLFTNLLDEISVGLALYSRLITYKKPCMNVMFFVIHFYIELTPID